MSANCIECEHSLCKLKILVPDNIDLEKYVDRAQSIFASPVVSFLKENADTCTVRASSGKELKEIQINLIYECKFGLEDSSLECQCKFAQKDSPSRVAMAVYRKKQSTEKVELNLDGTE